MAGYFKHNRAYKHCYIVGLFLILNFCLCKIKHAVANTDCYFRHPTFQSVSFHNEQYILICRYDDQLQVIFKQIADII